MWLCLFRFALGGFWGCRFNCLIFGSVLYLVVLRTGCRVAVLVSWMLWLWYPLRVVFLGFLVVVLVWFCGVGLVGCLLCVVSLLLCC